MTEANDVRLESAPLPSWLQRVGWSITVALGVLLPALTYFSTYTPPLFREAGLVAAIAGVIVVWTIGLSGKRQRFREEEGRSEAARGVVLIGAALATFVLYVLCLHQWSVTDPQGGELRIQIGFGTSDWGLTSIGKGAKSRAPEGRPITWLLEEASVGEDEVLLIWHPWVINAAGSLLIGIFLGSWLTFAWGLALVGRNTLSEIESDSLERSGNHQTERVVILFLGANPSDATQLALTREAQSIKDRLQSSRHPDRFEVEQQWEIVAAELPSKIMRFEPGVVHFSGHGSEQGQLVFLDRKGGSLSARSDVVTDVFRVLGETVKCVVLNACFSISQAKLIAQYVPTVVGMSDAIGDEAAIHFASAFYEALGYGKDIVTAFELGLIGVGLAGLDEDNVPRLILKDGIDARDVYFGT